MLSYLGKWAQQWWPRYMWTWSGMGMGGNKEATTELHMLSFLRILPSTPEARGWCVGKRPQWWICPLCDTQQLNLTSKAMCAFSRSVPNCGAPPSHPLSCSSVIKSDQQNSLPEPALSWSHSLAPCPCLHYCTTIHFRLGLTGLWHRPSVEISLCPACYRLAADEEGLPRCSNLSSTSALPQGCRFPPTHSFLLPFPYLTRPVYVGIFSCPFYGPLSKVLY